LRRRRLNERVLYEGQYFDEDSRNLPKLFEFMANQPVSEGFSKWCKRSGWNLVGHGNKYADCGSVLARGCDASQDHPEGKDFVRLFKRNCKRKACPVCYESWASAEAERSLIRLVAFKYGFRYVDRLISKVTHDTWKLPRRFFHERLQIELEVALKKCREKVIHVIVSPPPNSDFSVYSFPKLRRKAYSVLKRVGFKGGSMGFHPFRLRCRKCGHIIDDYLHVCSSCESTSFEWYPSPHFHTVGFGWIKGSDVEYKRSGWIVRNLGVRKSVFWTIQYILSHAGVFNDPNPCEILHEKKKFHVVTWFGELAYSKLRVPKIGSFPERCPYCARFLKPFKFGLVDRPPPIYDDEDSLNNEFLVEKGVWSVK